MERLGAVLVETYRIERLIAEGGMASVYEASHLRVPKRFAVKFLKVQLVSNAEALQRFRREAEIIATLDHPSIVHLIDYNFTDDGTPYIVLEFLDGENLGARMKRGRISLAETVRIAGRVADALRVAHARDITHRDLKPDNILLCSNDQVKVVDFGVAKLRHGPDLTAFNVVIGTVGYMAPEQISGQLVDPRTDQFALASIVYAMLTGGPAFEMEGSIAAQAMRILHHLPPDVEGVPRGVNEVLRRGMAKAPLHRYATVSEFSEALLAAAGETSEVVVPDEEGLPPLAADATSVTSIPFPSDESKEPPTDPRAAAQVQAELAPANAEPTAEIHRSQLVEPTLNAKTLQLAAVVEPPTPTPTHQGATLPPDSARTLPPMRPPPEVLALGTTGPAVALPAEGMRPRPERRGGHRWLWIAVGAAAGGSVAAAFWSLATH